MGRKRTHFCIDCGKYLTSKHPRCFDCSNKARRKYPYHNFCPDCERSICKTAIRCRPCSARFLVATGRRKLKNKPGKEHAAWKGGRVKTPFGYILIWKPEYPRADKNGYVREHILIWEQTHNQSLPEGWIIHHLNGIKDDNRSKNLVGLPNRKHYLVLQAKNKYIQELEALLNNQSQLL